MEGNEPAVLRARVFISCGQAKGTKEETTAIAISDRLRALGFEPYVAIQEQSLRGLKENIFARLEESEYYLFIDFKREKLLGKRGRRYYRGSLFAHQELALASYLGLEVLAFQEVGVKTDDGIMRFVQANATTFTDARLLANVVADKIRERGWDPNWRNELMLRRDAGQYSDAERIEPTPGGARRFMARFFHIDVQNRHLRKIATNCYVYLARVVNIETSEEIPLRSIEFKWAGYVLPNAAILPGQARRFDGLWLAIDRPCEVQFNIYSDATDYYPRIPVGRGRYRLTYQVISENFPPASGSFVLNLGNSIQQTTLE